MAFYILVFIMDKVSIYIPVTNSQELKKIIREISYQDKKDIEIILPPISATVRVSISEEFPYIEISYLNSKNNNLFVTEAINKSSGEYFKIVTNISNWPKKFLDHQTNILSKHTECTILSSKIKPSKEIISKKGISPLLPIQKDLISIPGKEAIDIFNFYEGNWIGFFEQTLWKVDSIRGTEDILLLNGERHPFKDEFVIYTQLLLKGNLLVDNHLTNDSIESWNTDSHAVAEEQFRKSKPYKIQSLKFTENINKLGFNGFTFGNTNITFANKKTISVDLIEILKRNDWHEKTRLWIKSNGPSLYIKEKLLKKIQADKEFKLIIETKSICHASLTDLNDFIEFKKEIIVDEINHNPEKTWILRLEEQDSINENFLWETLIELLDHGSSFSAVYTDFISIDELGLLQPAHLPTCNLDYILSQPKIFSNSLLVKLSSIKKYINQKENLNTLLQIITNEGLNALGHIPTTLINKKSEKNDSYKEIKEIQSLLCARGFLYSTVSGMEKSQGVYRIEYPHKEHPSVLIILDAKAGKSITQQCLTSIIKNTSYANYEILIIDSNNKKETQDWANSASLLYQEKIKAIDNIQYPSYVKKITHALNSSKSEYILFLDGASQIKDINWVQELLNQCMRPEIGASQPHILLPNGNSKNSGMILGYQGNSSSSPYLQCSPNTSGYLKNLLCARNISAVDISCFLIKTKSINKAIKNIIEGFDLDFNFSGPQFATLLSMSLTQQGKLITWTPHTKIIHFGEVIPQEENAKKSQTEKNNFNEDFLRKNLEYQISFDIFHNPNLSHNTHRIEPKFSDFTDWPRLLDKKTNNIALVHADFAGCGHYRIIQPAKSISDFLLANTTCTPYIPEFAELHRNNIDSIVLQRPFDEFLIRKIESSTKYKNILKIIDIDDNLTDLPKKNPAYQKNPQEMRDLMRNALSLADRFVVSTDALANFYSSLHSDIVVSRNYLPLHWWGSFKKKKTDKTKPRVGWAGGSSHQGDLELIFDLVKILHKEVDWIFMGMCPENIKPYIKEFHPGTHIEDYPKKLADLDLDLAIAPLEDNIFNICKSDLRLLEYGACGYPVVCSNIGPYKISDLPVTKVENNLRAWIDAIRSHIQSDQSNYEAGVYLQQKVLTNYVLNEKNSSLVLKNWV